MLVLTHAAILHAMGKMSCSLSVEDCLTTTFLSSTLVLLEECKNNSANPEVSLLGDDAKSLELCSRGGDTDLLYLNSIVGDSEHLSREHDLDRCIGGNPSG